jgi:hypothetical protein
MIIGIMLGMTGQSWKTVMKREREKELLFRGSQIKEAIENWNNPRYTVQGAKRHAPLPLTDLKFLLEDPSTLEKMRYLPHSYGVKLDDKNPRCGSDCPSLKLLQDPMTGKEWNILKCDVSFATNEICMRFPGNNTIIGVASKSDDEPLKTDFKDTALENMGAAGAGVSPGTPGAAPTVIGSGTGAGTLPATPGLAAKMTKYSEWKFIADPKNDHAKIYRAYHESW